MQSDAALRHARRASWGVLIAISLARFAFGYQLQTVASLGPLLVAKFHLDYAALGTLVGLYMLPGVVAAVSFGFVAQKLGDRMMLVAGMALMTAGSAATALAIGPAGIGVGRVAAGAGAVALTVLQGKVLADRFHGRGFLLSLSLMLGAFPIGIGVGQLTHAPLAHAFGWPAAFLAGAVPSALGCLLLLASWRGGGTAQGARPLGWPSLPECVLVILAGLIWTFHNAGFNAFLAYTPTLLAARHQPVWVIDAVMNVTTWGNLPAMLFGGAIAAKFGSNRVFYVGVLVATISVPAIALTGWPLLWGLIYGTIGAVHLGVVVGTGTLSARPQNRAVGMALFYTTYYLGGTILPALCGRAADLYGDPSGAFICGGAISALALPCWWIHRWYSRARQVAMA